MEHEFAEPMSEACPQSRRSRDLDFVERADIVGLSFVRRPEDVLSSRSR